uniref:Secreted protein n=1 Tax=Lutzomyia longipalpis TaxID=7200 RepID=A0A1B0CJ33_LUTLO
MKKNPTMGHNSVAWSSRFLATLVLLSVVVLVTHGRVVQPPTDTIRAPSREDSKNKGRMHEAFANAGRAKGLEIWRVEVKLALIFDLNVE